MTPDGTQSSGAGNLPLIAGNDPSPWGAEFHRPPFANCPSCNYSLTGLPNAYRCPECGFPYDEHTIAWVNPMPWTLLLSVVAVVVVLTFTVSFMFNLASGYVTLMLIGLGIPCTILSPLLLLRKPMVAITPAGVILRPMIRTDTVIPWHEAVAVKINIRKNRGLDSAWLITHHGKHSLRIVFDYENDMRRFDELFRKAQAHYLASSTNGPMP